MDGADHNIGGQYDAVWWQEEGRTEEVTYRESEESCFSCFFWERFGPPKEDTGDCLRYPPVPIIEPNEIYPASFQPETDIDSWCGEWKLEIDESSK